MALRTQLIQSIEHYVVLQEDVSPDEVPAHRDGSSTAETSASDGQSEGATLAQYRGWVDEILAMDTCKLELPGSKFSARKGRQKTKVSRLASARGMRTGGRQRALPGRCGNPV